MFKNLAMIVGTVCCDIRRHVLTSLFFLDLTTGTKSSEFLKDWQVHNNIAWFSLNICDQNDQQEDTNFKFLLVALLFSCE